MDEFVTRVADTNNDNTMMNSDAADIQLYLICK